MSDEGLDEADGEASRRRGRDVRGIRDGRERGEGFVDGELAARQQDLRCAIRQLCALHARCGRNAP